MKKEIKTTKTTKVTKTTKPVKAVKKGKKCPMAKAAKTTREDIRQAARVKKLDEEATVLVDRLEQMFKTITGGKFKELPAIDRHILLLLFNSLETYLAALSLKKHWESTRIRTPLGASLNNPVCMFWDFVFGRKIRKGKTVKPENAEKTEKTEKAK